ncbi:hypothetical protein [Streptomyces sp. NPDC048606]|uniref:hypothetical protein n=1 Tax=Streptomyces sp. NPDC048606 TaxID=3154726 RepID=UPI003432584E
MARRIPGQIMVDGRPMVVLTPKEYAGLIAMRRQVGGLGARLRVVSDTLRDTTEFLSELVAALESFDHGGSRRATGGSGRPLTPLLASAPELLRHAAGVVGQIRHRPARARRQ